MAPLWITVDGNEAAASVAHRVSEVIAIYPITPSTTMGELADDWSSAGRTNLWGQVPRVVEMQSEGGAAGAVHGALQAGALATTFTASQGLLLMIPNLYKIAGELTSYAMHVTARAVATHALSIFGDHSDVMACRQTGVALLSSGSVQEAHDFALIAHAATLGARVPFLHFFDGFRTSHEVNKIEALTDDDLRSMLPEKLIAAHRGRALTPDRPVVRGTAQNPDTFFQAREASNPFYDACPGVVRDVMAQFNARTGRSYRLFDYAGHPQAERVVVIMGSGAETMRGTADALIANGGRVGVLTVRLYRPFSIADFIAALPPTTRSIAVLDRTKEPGSLGEPLYLDVVAALVEATASGWWAGAMPVVSGGRYGLGSKEFTPAMAKAVFDELGKVPLRPHFTVGITDDVTRLSLPVGRFELDGVESDVVRAVFYGLGADGTVGANKNSIKIIGEDTANFAQGYFVYDSKKSGAITISHLRFGPRPIHAPYLIGRATFVACHQFDFLDKYDVLSVAEPGATFLVNAPCAPEEVWDHLSRPVQTEIIEKRLKLFAIDAASVARDVGMGKRINTIMQTCFFAISGVLPRDAAIAHIKSAIKKTYGKRGSAVIDANYAAVDRTLAALHEVHVPLAPTSSRPMPPGIPDNAPEFVQRVTAVMLAGHGDLLPVSAFPPDGTWPTGTAKWEKRNIAAEIPVWDEVLCIQCNKCALVCPHAAIRAKVYPASELEGAPATFKAVDFRTAGADFRGQKYTIQVAPEDCTGCTLCVDVCPAKDKANPEHRALELVAQRPLRDAERENFAFFLNLPEADRILLKPDVKHTQFMEPLIEFSGACAGCGETPYIKLLTQLFGDRALIANATGCSSIFGGNLPTTPYTVNRDGRGPAWANSLFEDNAEFGLGMRLAVDHHQAEALALTHALAARGMIGAELAAALEAPVVTGEKNVHARRVLVAELKRVLNGATDPTAIRLAGIADYLVQKSVWIVGGDGWAYDIGFGGLDHVLSLGLNLNILVLDTEVYSNTGGQQSKATPMGASAKFAAAGKSTAKKDLGLMAMAYREVYVARVAFGAKDSQTLKAFQEAEAYSGTSLIIAYGHCIAHGFELSEGLTQQKAAVQSGHWPLYRFDPRRVETGEPALVMDSGEPTMALETYLHAEGRYRMVEQATPERFRQLLHAAEGEVAARQTLYRDLATKKI